MILWLVKMDDYYNLEPITILDNVVTDHDDGWVWAEHDLRTVKC